MALAQFVGGSMKKLVTISRQFGSGGRIIGKIVAEKLGVKFYHKEIIEMATEESGIDKSIFEGEELRAKTVSLTDYLQLFVLESRFRLIL